MLRNSIEFIKQQAMTLLLLIGTGLLCAGTCLFVIWPAYKDPGARMFTSKLGYATVLRQTGQPFPVQTARAQLKTIQGVFLGEGLMQSEPIQIPMIAMSRINRIHVEEGDFVKKGQLLVELDPERIQLRIEAAQAALETARAELERVRVGTVNILLDERPELDEIQLEASKKSATIELQLLRSYEKLFQSGSLSEKGYLEQALKAKQAEVQYRKLLLSTELAAKGKENSLRIAEATIKEAEMAWQHRVAQLTDYKTFASADGVVERVLVHEGEYNQDPGRPAMIIASGLWFEANLDQTALGQVTLGDRVEVRLGAFQDRIFTGTVTRINPLVNFSLGGPETNRPIRPLGTGAPEWPATFAVRIKLDELPPNQVIVPGLTGFARITSSRTGVCVPRGAVTAISGNRGIVFVLPEGKNQCEPRDVTIGWTEDAWTEITSGIDENDLVIADGYQVLEPGDYVKPTGTTTPPTIITAGHQPTPSTQVSHPIGSENNSMVSLSRDEG